MPGRAPLGARGSEGAHATAGRGLPALPVRNVERDNSLIMNASNSWSALSRREFLGNSASLATVAATGAASVSSLLRAAEEPSARESIGIQVGAVSFVDEGTEKVLEILQERGPWTRFT